jgi:hypothetical protein
VNFFFRNLKEITLIVFKLKTGEALPLTAPQANSKTNSVQTRTNPQGPKGFGLPELLENRHMKVARLSNLHSGLTYAQGDNPGTYFCPRLLKCSRKDYVNGTRDLPACSAMLNPTAPTHPPDKDPR